MKFISLLILLLSLTFGSSAQKLDNVVKKINTLTHKPKTPLKPVSPNLENVEYPFPVNFLDLNLQNQDLKMAYMDVPSKKPNGDVVLLMHGKNFCSAYWKKTATDLSKAGYRVIMPDQIGFGKSSKPQQLYYSFQLLAQNTKTILDSLDIKHVIVLGHSMGGMLATRFTLMYPDLVKKLILENPIGLEDYKLTVPFQTVDENYKKELKQTYERLKDYQQTNYYGDHWKPEYDEWLNILAGMTLNADYPRIAWNAALTTEMIYMQPVCYEFEKITAPTLLLIGQRDRTALVNLKTTGEVRSLLGNYPELGKLTAKKIPNSQLVEIANVGHLPHIEAYPQFITPLLSFLKNEGKTNEKNTQVKTAKSEKVKKSKLINLKAKPKDQPEDVEKTVGPQEKVKQKEEKVTENPEKNSLEEKTKDRETENAESVEEKSQDLENETETIGTSKKAEQKIKAKKKEIKTQKPKAEAPPKAEEKTENTETEKTENSEKAEEKTEDKAHENETETIGTSKKAEQKIKTKKKETKTQKQKAEAPSKSEEKTEHTEAEKTENSEKAEEKTEDRAPENETETSEQTKKNEQKIKHKKEDKKTEKTVKTKELQKKQEETKDKNHETEKDE